jgi:hypothetical protein
MRYLVPPSYDLTSDNYCTQNDVELIFRLGTGNPLGDRLVTAIFAGPPPMDGTEDSFHSFWDINIRHILENVLPRGRSIRNSNFHTETGILRPNFAFLLKDLALFRGEEKPPGSRADPKGELSEKLAWAYRPAPYILGECL